MRTADDPSSTNPPLVVASYDLHGVSVDVVRDDLLFAGTKQRGAGDFAKTLISLRKGETTMLLYTAPFNGFGPVAVAHCAQSLQLQCTLILTRRPISANRSVPLELCLKHETVCRAKACGAQIFFADTWDEMRKKGFELYNANSGVLWVPVGLSRPLFIDILAVKIRAAAEHCQETTGKWKRLFVAGGTGALGVALSRVFPQAQIHIVPAAIDDDGVSRIKKTVGNELLETKRVVILSHHVQSATLPPTPYPSVPGYDEIVWSRVSEDPQVGDAVWNVAGFTLVSAAVASPVPVNAEGSRPAKRARSEGE